MLIDDLKKIAKEHLVRDGGHQPIFFLCSDEQILGEPLPTVMFDQHYKDNLNAEDSKTRSVYCMGILARKLRANRLIMIWDAAMRMATPGTNLENLGTEDMPLQFPRSMRTECLIINDISFITGKDITTVIPYKGGAGKPVEFLANVIPDGASLDSRFTDIALKGYNKS